MNTQLDSHQISQIPEIYFHTLGQEKACEASEIIQMLSVTHELERINHCEIFNAISSPQK